MSEDKPKKPRGRPFPPGVSGNPKGRPKTRGDLAQVRLLKESEAKRMIQKQLDMTPQELKAMVEDPETPAMELMIARIIDKALNEGDTARLNFLFDRTIGKVIEKREVEVRPVTYKTTVNPVDGTLIQEALEEDKGNLENEAEHDHAGSGRSEDSG